MDRKLLELAVLFLRLGATAFGGPAAHIALMEREFVTERKWISRQQFLDIVGSVNLIPGPNSTETAMHIGYDRAGRAGLVVAGVCFILPAAVLVLLLAWLYEQYGTLPASRWLLTGVQPVVVAIVFHALWNLARSAIKGIYTATIAGACIGLACFRVNELHLIFAAAAIGLIVALATAKSSPEKGAINDTGTSGKEQPKQNNNALLLLAAGSIASQPFWQILWVFLKIGSVVYGSGYVLLAFLRAELVHNLHWISDRQLLDAVAVGQFTPGPVFTTATFIGYLVGGFSGGIAATLGIFLPSFLFVFLLAAGLEKLRSSPRARVFLDAVNAASLSLMFVVAVQLCGTAFNDAGIWLAGVTFAVALILLCTTKINSLWLMIGGAVAGFLLHHA